MRTGGEGDAEGLLAGLGLAACRDKFPWQMSAGEKQRVAIARAVVHRPAVIFADESTASLDRANADLAIDCLRRATSKTGCCQPLPFEPCMTFSITQLDMGGGFDYSPPP